MRSSKDQAAADASRQYETLAKEAYGLGIPMLANRNAALMPALRQANLGQLPSYMESAFDMQRTGVAEGILGQERKQIGAQDMAAKRTVAGGNAAATMNPAQMGSLLADAMMGMGANTAIGLGQGFSGAQMGAIGQMSQGGGWGGALSGAASGAATGASIPGAGWYGAAIGGVLGGVGGYFG